MSSCLNCRHWLPKETPGWAVRLGLAICGRKQTKAVTMSHWAACPRWQAADAVLVGARSGWLVRCGAKVFINPIESTQHERNT